MTNHASVTETPCTCGYLDLMSKNTNAPIEFDKKMNEFILVSRHDDGSSKFIAAIHHCPWCGGTAPESIRQKSYAFISGAEQVRISEMFAGLDSFEAVIEKFGAPNRDASSGIAVSWPERDGSPPRSYSGRSLRYDGLSDVANVHVNLSNDGGIFISLTGKSLSRKSKD